MSHNTTTTTVTHVVRMSDHLLTEQECDTNDMQTYGTFGIIVLLSLIAIYVIYRCFVKSKHVVIDVDEQW